MRPPLTGEAGHSSRPSTSPTNTARHFKWDPEMLKSLKGAGSGDGVPRQTAKACP